MSLQVIPTEDGATLPAYEITTTLDGVPFRFFFQYNLRQSCWFLSIATSDGHDVWNGIKLVCLWDLLFGCADDRRPAGRLIVTSSSTDLSPPELSDLAPGGRCALQYAPAADVAAIRAGTFSATA